MLLFNKSALISLVLTLNFTSNIVASGFSNVLDQIDEVINNSGNQQPQQPQQQQQQQQHVPMNHKVMLSDGPQSETQESNKNFESLLGNGQNNRDGIFGKIPNPLCLFPGACPSISTKVPVPATSSKVTTPTSAATTKSNALPPIIPTSFPPIFPPIVSTSSTPTITTTATSAVTTTTSSESAKPTDVSNTDWGSLAQLFFNLFKTLVEAILKSIKSDK